MPKVKATVSPKLFVLILVLSDKPAQSLFYRFGGQVQAPHATPPVVKKSFANPMLHHWEWVRRASICATAWTGLKVLGAMRRPRLDGRIQADRTYCGRFFMLARRSVPVCFVIV